MSDLGVSALFPVKSECGTVLSTIWANQLRPQPSSTSSIFQYRSILLFLFYTTLSKMNPAISNLVISLGAMQGELVRGQEQLVIYCHVTILHRR